MFLSIGIIHDYRSALYSSIRFSKKRLGEELEVVRRKVLHLRAETEGSSSIVGRLKQEYRELMEILKCSICLDRPKEVKMFIPIYYFLVSWTLYYCCMIFLFFLH